MMPSPVYWLIVPSKRCTPSERIAKKRSMIRCHSSGSIDSERSIEPFTSANSTVTCLRSPSRALLDVRIFSARCLGVYELGSRSLVLPAAPSARGARHFRQNFARGEQLVTHDGHSRANDPPHSSQKTASASLEALQEEHFTDRNPSRDLLRQHAGRTCAGDELANGKLPRADRLA